MVVIIIIIVLVILAATAALVVIMLLKNRMPPSVMDNALKKKVELKETLTDDEKRIVQNAYLVEAIRVVATKSGFDTELLKADLLHGSKNFMYEDIKAQVKIAIGEYVNVDDVVQIINLNKDAILSLDDASVKRLGDILMSGLGFGPVWLISMFVQLEREAKDTILSKFSLKFHYGMLKDPEGKDALKFLDAMYADIFTIKDDERLNKLKKFYGPFLSNLVNYYGYQDYFFGDVRNKLLTGIPPVNNKLSFNYLNDRILQLQKFSFKDSDPVKALHTSLLTKMKDLLEMLRVAIPSTHTFYPKEGDTRILIALSDADDSAVSKMIADYYVDAGGNTVAVGSSTTATAETTAETAATATSSFGTHRRSRFTMADIINRKLNISPIDPAVLTGLHRRTGTL